ncbi:hypothetical protein F7725_024378, partial [Dissostichus mawsoni]
MPGRFSAARKLISELTWSQSRAKKGSSLSLPRRLLATACCMHCKQKLENVAATAVLRRGPPSSSELLTLVCLFPPAPSPRFDLAQRIIAQHALSLLPFGPSPYGPLAGGRARAQTRRLSEFRGRGLLSKGVFMWPSNPTRRPLTGPYTVPNPPLLRPCHGPAWAQGGPGLQEGPALLCEGGHRCGPCGGSPPLLSVLNLLPQDRAPESVPWSAAGSPCALWTPPGGPAYVSRGGSLRDRGSMPGSVPGAWGRLGSWIVKGAWERDRSFWHTDGSLTADPRPAGFPSGPVNHSPGLVRISCCFRQLLHTQITWLRRNM